MKRVLPRSDVQEPIETSATDPIDRLTAVGFGRVGCWRYADGRLKCDLDEGADGTNVHYAFVVDGKVCNDGKSVRSLRQRMRGYQTPHVSQRTNVRNGKDLLDAISAGKSAEIVALFDNGLLHYGGFHVNLAAGLEDSLIRDLLPPWNGGK